MTIVYVGLVRNNFDPTRLSQVSHAESPVVEDVEVVPVLVVKVQGVLEASVSPTLTLRPMPYDGNNSLADNNTVLTVVPGGRVIVKLHVTSDIVIKR